MAMHALIALVWLASLGCGEREQDASRDVLVRVSLVGLDAQNVPVLILEEQAGLRLLPISIGPAEASSIDAEIHHQRPARPNSHDFAARLIAELDGELLRVIVTELRGGTFYAVLVIETQGKRVEIDARPSDAIATALRVGAPILVRDQVFDEAGEEPEPDAHRRAIKAPAARERAPATRGVEL
jgi:hypothetical protein